MGYGVTIPNLPHTDSPTLAEQLPVAQEQLIDSDTILIGHSSGCALGLSLLENSKTRIRQTILVAGYARSVGNETEENPMLQQSYDWEQIKRNCGEFVFLNSDNDPWGCTDTEGRYMLDRLGGKLILMKGEGHMGSDSFNQPYKEFPFLLQLIN